MSTFSERYGYKQVRQIIQRESADEILRTDLWNFLYTKYFTHDSSIWKRIVKHLWYSYFKKKVDEFDASEALSLVRNSILNGDWHVIYDLIELIPYSALQITTNPIEYNNTLQILNKILAINLSAYRFVNYKIVEITSEEEIAAIEETLNLHIDSVTPVKIHLRRALELLADRKTPDYRNSIKESISAVEALACIISDTPKATLGQALKIIDEKHKIHNSLKGAFEKLYGYTSDADGIRHSLLNNSELKQEDAKFMLVACSAFINYLVAKNQ